MAAHIAAGMKHPDNMTRKEKLQKIASLPYPDAQRFWVTHCSRISRKSFEEVAKQ